MEMDSADRVRVGTFPFFVSNCSGCRQLQQQHLAKSSAFTARSDSCTGALCSMGESL